MKTYLHYLAYLLREAWKEDRESILIGFWIFSSMGLLFGGALGFAFSATMGQVNPLWLLLTLSGVIDFLCPLVYDFLRSKYRNYKEWKETTT